MKTKLIAAILVLAASFNVFAQDAAADLNPAPSRTAQMEWPMPL
jgi:hypothetical protein